MTSQSDPNRRIRQRRRHSPMHHASDILQFIPQLAFDGDAIIVPPKHTNAKQLVEWHVVNHLAKVGEGQRNTLYHRGMKLQDKVVIVTGGGNGIGRALCRRFAAEGAKVVAVADIEQEAARQVAVEIGGCDFGVDVSSESDVQGLVDEVLKRYGQIDLFCSNAGIGVEGDCYVPDREWQRIWEINVMAHVYASRAVLPAMLARQQGYLLQTVSAAGLLTQIGSAPYAVTKHAALALAEWLAITYGDQGIKVSALCPQGVKTRMLEKAEFGGGAFLLEGALDPDQVAEAVVKGIDAELFLILPHPEVLEYIRRKTGDYDRWLKGMRRLQANMQPLKVK